MWHVIQPEKLCFQRICMHGQKTKRKYSIDNSRLWVTEFQVTIIFIFFYLFLALPKIVFVINTYIFQSEKINTLILKIHWAKIQKKYCKRFYLCSTEKPPKESDSQVPELLTGKHLEGGLICSPDCFAVVFARLPTVLFFLFIHIWTSYLVNGM